ncbi:hypothetical protein PISMIDRAFT_688067 [Pisolithus microcarpus 441]|uniref:Uncharacterized protein n=1 Tax=Pisolithus microcarpus 441 TaxID=765257 RepID=A0A0C9YC11_9AGAM|nr:hypothetical protein PISMIDRAFT_688067 [Pisolithus microcarpus 441]
MSSESTSPTPYPSQDTSRNPDPSAADRPAPQHRLHDSNQPLPRPEGRERENYERAPEDVGAGQEQRGTYGAGEQRGGVYGGDEQPREHYAAQRTAPGTGVGTERRDEDDFQGARVGRNAYTTDRPLGVQPVPEGEQRASFPQSDTDGNFVGGVAIGGQRNLDTSQAGITDKIFGKTEKVRCIVSGPSTGDTQSDTDECSSCRSWAR